MWAAFDRISHESIADWPTGDCPDFTAYPNGGSTGWTATQLAHIGQCEFCLKQIERCWNESCPSIGEVRDLVTTLEHPLESAFANHMSFKACRCARIAKAIEMASAAIHVVLSSPKHIVEALPLGSPQSRHFALSPLVLAGESDAETLSGARADGTSEYFSVNVEKTGPDMAKLTALLENHSQDALYPRVLLCSSDGEIQSSTMQPDLASAYAGKVRLRYECELKDDAIFLLED